ncbi:branched-chain amino acid transport system permease protein [Sedimentibacter acidaminivorans]|uniref:Branched-chain amino acid transport system permease protein n=1 Tax=Sedimentibacter acidaminivorans TaxID=913099 RepID=A0ABS4GGT0_9FIRM|nr:branched-chain amino acid ABC transporter permease [Sedimentibacter acidaminivorans]MBP1926902.1 branched-chain amino acid transport system permease protein [Sedimentibacter acidaminivorans]
MMINNNRKLMRRSLTVLIIIAFASIIILLDTKTIGDNYVRRILNLGAIYAIVSVSMNLVNGFTGLFSLGQAGFMAIGAFTVAVFTVPVELREAIFYIVPQNPLVANIELPFFVALILGGLLAALVSILIGMPVLRLKSDYLAIATLGFSEIIRIIFTNMKTITNGALGINRIPGIPTMWITFGVAIVSIIFIVLLINSSYGRAFKAIREDDIAAEAMGINLFKHKVISFAIGAFFAGIGGGLLASLLGTVDPKQFYFTMTYNFLLIIVLGGMGSVSGTIIGSFVVTAGLEYLRIFDEPLTVLGVNIPIFRAGFRMVIFSFLLMILVLFFRQGIMGQKELSWDMIEGWFKRRKGLPKKGKVDKGGTI